MDKLQSFLCFCIIILLFENKNKYNSLYTGKLVNISIPRKLSIYRLNEAIHSDTSFKKHVLKSFHISGYTPATLVEDIQKIKTCINDVRVYRNKQWNSTIAYVSTFKISNDIFVNTEYWDTLPMIIQIKTLIHECSHLILNTQDNAYRGSELFIKLNGLQAKQNADTLTEVIITLSRSATVYYSQPLYYQI